jgi:hypothetical protein
MEDYFFWAHLSGAIAMCFSIAAWQFKSQKHIVGCYIPSSAFWAIQYFMLGVPNAGLFAIACIFKDAALFKLSEKYFRAIIGIFFISNVLFISLFYASALDLLPLIIILFVNLPLTKNNNRYWVARGNIMAQCCWIIFNLHAGAFMGIICACFIIGSTLLGMARYEKWEIGKCYLSFAPSLARALFIKPQTYP